MPFVVVVSDADRRKRRDLKSFYGLEGEANGEVPAGGESTKPAASTDPCDINSPHFQPDVYLNKLIQASITNLRRIHTTLDILFSKIIALWKLED